MSYSRPLLAFKQLFFAILLLISFAAKGYDERFTLTSHDESVTLNIQLEDGHKIYWQKSGNTGLPTVIDFVGSTNLADYAIWWPSPDIDIIDDITNYTCSGNVSIPLQLKAFDRLKTIGLKVNLSYVICGDQCVPVKQVIETVISEPKQGLMPLYATLLAAFLGGLILNFMPCVLPVLALKLMSAANLGSGYKSSFSVTLLGIMTSFWTLALASILMRNTGEQFGVGMGFQQTEFIIFLCILITIFISLTLGKTHMRLPGFLSNIDSLQPHSMSSSNGISFLLKDFMAGMIATLLSVPCTAPFLGSAILVAIMGTPLESFLIFTSAGLGFGLPYLLLIISPNLLKWLPKPGQWMESAKKFLAMLFIASLLWLLWLVYGQLDLRATFGLFLLLMLIKFVLEEPRMRAKFLCLVVLIAGALYLPQLAHKEDASFEAYSDRVWQEFDRNKLHELVKEGKVVVVDVTADWCLTCKYNKFLVWDRAKMLKLLSHPEVVAMRADATIYRKDIEDYLKEYGVYGIPFTVIYGPRATKGIVMPTLVGYDDVARAIARAAPSL